MPSPLLVSAWSKKIILHYSTEDDSVEYALLCSHGFSGHTNMLKCFICHIHHILYFTCMGLSEHSYFLVAPFVNVIRTF